MPYSASSVKALRLPSGGVRLNRSPADTHTSRSMRLVMGW